jgi:hypothetical protein
MWTVDFVRLLTIVLLSRNSVFIRIPVVAIPLILIAMIGTRMAVVTLRVITIVGRAISS